MHYSEEIAFLIASGLWGSELQIKGDERDKLSTVSYRGELLVSVDFKGISIFVPSVSLGDRTNFADIYEGGPSDIAQIALSDLKAAGYVVSESRYLRPMFG